MAEGDYVTSSALCLNYLGLIGVFKWLYSEVSSAFGGL